MAKDNQILVRVNDPTDNAVENFAEDRDYNKAEAVRRILESRLTSEGYLTQEHYGSDEPEPIADGGQVVRPMLNFLGAFYAAISLSVFAILTVRVYTGTAIPYVDFLSLFGAMVSALIIVAADMLFLYTDWPEKIDRVLYSGVRRVSRFKSGLGG